MPEPGAPPRVLAVGEAIPGPGGPGAARRRAALPIDVARTVEQLFVEARLDLCHVHEPFAPSVASAALRHSRALNVGTFHAPTERVVATQVARSSSTSSRPPRCARGELRRHRGAHEPPLPGPVRGGAAGADPVPARLRDAGGPVQVVFVDDEERGALRLFLRALRRLETGVDWRATVVTDRGASSSIPLREDLGARVSFVEGDQGDALAAADVCVLASDGAKPAPGLALRAVAAGRSRSRRASWSTRRSSARATTGCSSTPAIPTRAPASSPGCSRTGAARPSARRGPAAARAAHVGPDDGRPRGRLPARAARRHPVDGRPRIRRRLVGRQLIDVDLHMHTDHSRDCATPVDVLLATARDQGFGAIAVTDHNVVSGALEARAKAADYGVKVIVAEEVKTATRAR